jgi:hypothetical protein
MRGLIFALPLLSLAACNVTKDDGNDSVTVQYDQNTAENAAADVGNTAQNIASDIGNDVQNTGEKIQNKIGDDHQTNTSTTTTTTTTENKAK